MAAFKKLNRQDVYISDYTARKNWNATGSLVDTYNIQTLRAVSSSVSPYPYPTDLYRGQYQTLLHSSLDHLYYFDATGSQFSGRRELSLQSTLTLPGTRQLGEYATVFSLPRDVIGTHIEPNTIVIKPYLVGTGSKYIDDFYVTDHVTGLNEYIQNLDSLLGSTFDDEDYLVSESNYVTESAVGTTPGQYMDIIGNQQRVEIIDDGEGALIFSGSDLSITKGRQVVGDVIYNQGQIILTNREVGSMYTPYLSPDIAWKSNQPIYTYNVHCRVKDSEMNYSYNPSTTTGSNGDLRNDVTGSYFTPYVTTVGLYNDANELLAVAKTNKPIKKSRNTDMTFVVKLDM